MRQTRVNIEAPLYDTATCDLTTPGERLVCELNRRCSRTRFKYGGIARESALERYQRNVYPSEYRNLPVHLVQCCNTVAPQINGERLKQWSGERTWRVNEGYIRDRFEHVVEQLIADADGKVVVSDRICY